jgi:hypothetical protein
MTQIDCLDPGHWRTPSVHLPLQSVFFFSFLLLYSFLVGSWVFSALDCDSISLARATGLYTVSQLFLRTDSGLSLSGRSNGSNHLGRSLAAAACSVSKYRHVHTRYIIYTTTDYYCHYYMKMATGGMGIYRTGFSNLFTIGLSSP